MSTSKDNLELMNPELTLWWPLLWLAQIQYLALAKVCFCPRGPLVHVER